MPLRLTSATPRSCRRHCTMTFSAVQRRPTTACLDVAVEFPHRSASLIAAGALVLILVALGSGSAARAQSGANWPTYGHDLHRTFATQTGLTPASVLQLAPAWF